MLLLLLTGVYFLYDTYFAVGGFDIGYCYLIAMFIMAVCVGSFLYSPDTIHFAELLRLSGILAIPFLICQIISMLIYVFHFTEIRQMISGFFQIVYVLIAIFTAGSVLYLLKKRAVSCLFWAETLAFFMMALVQMREVGIREFFYQFYVMLKSGTMETLPAMGVLSNTGFSYSYGMFFLYFVCRWEKKESPRFLVRISVCVLCLILGSKRSALLALAVSFCVAFVFQRLPNFLRKPYFHLLTAFLFFFAVLIIPFIRYGLFAQTAEFFHVNLNSRDIIYQFYADYYEISPFYFGRGLGWVKNFLSELRDSLGYTWMTSVHDEYLRSYIELGFWGYLFWILSNFLWLPKKLVSLQDVIHSAAIIGCIVYLAVMYLTENIFFHFTSMLVWAAIIMESYSASNAGDLAA